MRYQGLLLRRESRGVGLRLARRLSVGLIFTLLVFNGQRFGCLTSSAAGPPPCLTVSAAGPVWQSLAFVSSQSGTFTAEMDATPLGNGIDAGVGLSNGPQTAFSGLACIARFNTSGNIDARNGGAYAAASPIAYSANTSYHFRFVVNVPSHTYSVYVTPSGGSEQAVGVNYAFRTEQASVASLNYWSLWGDTGSMQGCGFGAPCYTAAAGGGWLNNSFASQANTFTAEWDATPSATNIDAVVALSNGAQTSFAGFACLVRFNVAGMIDARDGGIYHAANTILYAANTTYHFRVAVNVPSHTYSVYVTPTGGSEQTVGLNYAFRTEQQTVTSLNNYGLIVDSAAGSARLCNFSTTSDPFGIAMLNPTVPGGREWYSKWGNGHSRTITFGQDPDDPEFHGRGDATYSINGQGVLTASGSTVRMYVYDPAFLDTSVYNPNNFTTWNNVEVTVYFMRVSDSNIAYGGIVAGAKIRHIPDSDLCGTRGYYARMRDDGGIDVEKEIRHPDSVAIPSSTPPWSSLPYNVWIGYKQIIRDVDGGTHVKQELWRDMTDGANGGTWEKLYEHVDTGGWGAGHTPCASGVDPAQILTGPNLSVFLRDDSVTDVRYKKWSIREIAGQ
jgi:hypothetical protein